MDLVGPSYGANGGFCSLDAICTDGGSQDPGSCAVTTTKIPSGCWLFSWSTPLLPCWKWCTCTLFVGFLLSAPCLMVKQHRQRGSRQQIPHWSPQQRAPPCDFPSPGLPSLEKSKNPSHCVAASTATGIAWSLHKIFWILGGTALLEKQTFLVACAWESPCRLDSTESRERAQGN